MARSAEALLQGKVANPVGAALGGYALLRLNELDRLHDWPDNLAAWFAWLPDGAVSRPRQPPGAVTTSRRYALFRSALGGAYRCCPRGCR